MTDQRHSKQSSTVLHPAGKWKQGNMFVPKLRFLFSTSLIMIILQCCMGSGTFPNDKQFATISSGPFGDDAMPMPILVSSVSVSTRKSDIVNVESTRTSTRMSRKYLKKDGLPAPSILPTNIPRGGGIGRGAAVAVPVNDKALTVLPVAPQPTSNGSITSTVENLKATAKKIKRAEMLTLLALRVAFVLLLPLSAASLVLCLALSLLLTALRIVTLNFLFRDISKIFYALSKCTLALTLASLSGILSPIFATFGLLAALSLAILQLAEPIFRIRYHRQMKKIQHLNKLIHDPVLLDTLNMVMRGAAAVSAAAGESTKKGIEGTKKRTRKAGQYLQNKGEEASREIVNALVTSGGVVAFGESLKKTLPPSVSLWGSEQFEALRKSGALEQAAGRVLNSLREDLVGAQSFLPYLEAIDGVRKRQLELQRKEGINVSKR